ncbi:MAG: hypothetical protein CVU78_02890 [Elusimicrobia bacterium HGW-Elusimicrobia-2]|nr:MAG: hypothetical protein CVU78_02890 [Elusimicrobia bacterium HGW-Elusimicrobia-2]
MSAGIERIMYNKNGNLEGAGELVEKIGCHMPVKKQNVLKVFALLVMVVMGGCMGEDTIETKKLKPQEKNPALQKENLKFSERIDQINSQVNMAEIKANLAGLRTAISIYYNDKAGVSPSSLEELSPRYIAKIPEGDWDYNPATGELISKSHPEW